MGAFVRWVLLPIAIVALGLAWQFYEYADAVQETCGPDCISSGDLAAWRAAFLIALALWIGSWWHTSCGDGARMRFARGA